MQSEAVRIERSTWIAAPRDRVWQAVSAPEQIAQWFLPPALGATMSLDASGKLTVLMGPMAAEIAAVEATEAPRRLTMRGKPDGVIATTYTLEEVDGGTKVTVTMHGFEQLPQDSRHDRVAPSEESWEKALANLKAYVEGAALPHPEGFIAALFGYRRMIREVIAVERSIWVKAPVERVWSAISDPARIQQWFSPGTEWRGTGLRVGATLAVVDAETGSDTHVQVIDALEPPHLLVTRSVVEPPQTPEVTRWQLIAENGGTRVWLTYSGYELMPLESRHDLMEQNAFGFGMLLENLKAQIEGTELPYPWGF
jgi:uncharacterized protein YndB with AHSA1/START domain